MSKKQGKGAFPHPLLDAIIGSGAAKTDAEIALLLNTHPPTISRMRRGKLAVKPRFILAIHDATGMPLDAIRAML